MTRGGGKGGEKETGKGERETRGATNGGRISREAATRGSERTIGSIVVVVPFRKKEGWERKPSSDDQHKVAEDCRAAK